MRYLFGLLSVCALGVVPLVGCSDDNGAGGSGGSAGTGGTGGTGGVEMISVSTIVSGFDPAGGPIELLEDVEICETDTDNCVMTDADGAATLQLPLNQETSVTVEKEGYQSELLAVLLSAEPPAVFENGMGTVERIEFQHGLVGSPYPMEGTGLIIASWYELGAFPGATLDLAEPATGKRFFHDEESNWDADLTETSSYPIQPKGGFTEVSPGVVQVAFGGTAEGCVPLIGWPGGVDNSVRVPVRAGYTSEFILSCDAP